MSTEQVQLTQDDLIMMIGERELSITFLKKQMQKVAQENLILKQKIAELEPKEIPIEEVKEA